VRVRFTPEARLAVREKRAWWEQHREKAPRLFVQELADVVAKLRDRADDERQHDAVRGGRVIWRLLMPKTRNHIYYRVDDGANQVEILLVWNAVAGATPDFR
jgi:plasmid stabilization system protein ParE